jgi:hypothetical protein
MREENGAMVSEWILLVSDGDDDQKFNGKGTNYELNDQTLLADFGSKIIVTFPKLNNAQVEFQAQKAVGKVTLNISYMSPAGDVPPDKRAFIDLEPYLHYARKLLRERTQSMSAGVAGAASILLASEGNKEDAALMKWAMESRPWLADSVTRELDSLNRRLGLPKQESRPSLKDRPPTSQEPSSKFQSVDQNAPALADKENPETIRWIGLSLALLVTGGLFGLMFKKRK